MGQNMRNFGGNGRHDDKHDGADGNHATGGRGAALLTTVGGSSASAISYKRYLVDSQGRSFAQPTRLRLPSLHVHKEGFRDYASSTSVGGSAHQTIVAKLERELHEGRVSIAVPSQASVFVDGQPVAVKPNNTIELKLPSGGHTLRVTAPGMRTYQSELVVKDNEARAVAVTLEKDAEAEKPKLRVAVGCIDATPRGTEDGLSVYFDNSPAGAIPSGDHKTRSEAGAGKDVVEYVEYPISSGDHLVSVRVPGCEAMQTSVMVDTAGGAYVRGILRSDASLVSRGAAGNPDWGRIGLALWRPGTLERNENGVGNFEASAVGLMVEPGLAFRWFTLGLDAGLASGSGGAPTSDAPAPDVLWFRFGGRAGVRLPLSGLAINLGVETGYDALAFAGLPSLSGLFVGGWMSVDVHVACDWMGYGGVDFDRQNKANGEAVILGFRLGVAFQPNTRCRHERSNDFYGLSTSDSAK